MGKKALWILVAVLSLALIGTVSLLGVNQWKANQAEAEAAAQQKEKADQAQVLTDKAEAEAAAQQKEKADQAQVLIDRDKAFVTAMRGAAGGVIEESNPEATVKLGQGLCEVMAEEESTSESWPPLIIATYLTTSEEDPYTSEEAAHVVSLSVNTFCPEQGPATFEEILTILETDPEAAEEELAEEQSQDSRAVALKAERFVTAIRNGIPFYKSLPEDLIVDLGEAVCAGLKNGGSVEQMVRTFTEAGRTIDEAKLLTAGAMGAFCYEEIGKLSD